MNNFQQRLLTASVFGCTVIGLILINAFTFGILFLAINILCQIEFYRLLKDTGYGVQKWAGIVAGSCFVASTFLVLEGILPENFLFINLLFVCWIFIAEMYRHTDKPFENIGDTLISLFYISLPMACMVKLGFINGSFQFHLPLGILIILWSNDSGAYLTGISIGKNKLIERISPKKTWEGFFGGVVIAIVSGLVLSFYFTEIATIHWIVIALIVSVLGTFGDLVESMFKRSINIKDSGNLLPGHGGVLDRFDGLFLAAPMVVVYLEMIK